MAMHMSAVVVAAAVAIGCTAAGRVPQAPADPAAGSRGSSSTARPDDSTDRSTGLRGGDEPSPSWAPGVVYPSPRALDARGFIDLRGPIHTHSPYSWDACDRMPRDIDGNLSAACVEDLRRDLCHVKHDFVFFTDHRNSFEHSEFPDVLLFDPTRGDVLVRRGGDPVANWAGCHGIDHDARATLVMAGCESAVMPVGLEAHAPGRGSTYGSRGATAVAKLHAKGAVVLVAHPENFDIEELLALSTDGFEMYNLHANTLQNAAALGILLEQLSDNPAALPHPDLLLLPIFSEDPRYMERWATVLARGGRPVTTMAADAHRNALPQLLADGERIDSFRRMLQSFSNHLRVRPEPDGSWDDRHVKEALAARRLYGAFEYLGYPEGFDAWMEAGVAVHEIGDVASLGDAPEIVVSRPRVRGLDPSVTTPEVELRVLAARDGRFDVVAQSTASYLRFTPDVPGAYRVEVRIAPKHLTAWLGAYQNAAHAWRPWIYANAFFIEP
jgi:hypothetical protein